MVDSRTIVIVVASPLIITSSFNLCGKPKMRSQFEKTIFDETFDGFHVKIGNLCPIKVKSKESQKE
jgi:hypothetical protein